jgi:hypothetical protein
MYFRYQQIANLITIDDDYAELVSISPDGNLQFQFTYSVNPSTVLNYNANVVAVTVLSRYVHSKDLLGLTQRGIIDNKSIINNVRSLLPDAKTAVQQRDKYVIASNNSNIMSFVNNEVIQQMLAQVPSENIQQLNTPQLNVVKAGDIKNTNNSQPVLQRIANSAAVPDLQNVIASNTIIDLRTLMYDMLVRQGLDPTYISQLTSRSQDEISTRGGLSNTSTALEKTTDPASQLLNYHVFPTSLSVPPTNTDQLIDNDLVTVLSTITSSTVEVPVNVTLLQSKLKLENADLTKVFVQFDLLNSNSNEPIDTVIKTLDITKEIQVYNTPKLPPTLKTSVSAASTYATLRVKQNDPGATSVSIYKKSIFVASSDLDSYSLIGTYSLTSRDQALQVQIDVPQSCPTIYRAIPVGVQATLGFEFNNAVVKPLRYTPLRSIALTGVQVNEGIQIEMRKLPTKVIAIQLLRWNMTTFDKLYTTVNGDVAFIDDATRAADLVVIVDNNVFDSNIYRYVARLIYTNGVTEDFGDVTLEFVKPAPGQVSVTTTNLAVSDTMTAPNVTFTIAATTAATDMDQITQMLTNQNLQQYFQGDVQSQRDQLQKLIAYSVQRVDLSTGKREDFGTITTNNFDDSALRKNRAIDPLQYSHLYRYEIYPLLRASETMFDGFVKTSIDPTTKKPYSFSPAKFLHPLALTRGVLVSTQGASQRYAKDPMSFGIVGSLVTVNVSFNISTSLVSNLTATNFNRDLNIISWQANGDITQVDHFLVFKLVNGVKTLIGKAHSQFPTTACQYFHQVTKHDDGGISYVVTPVMNDYNVGVAVTSNTIIVDAS